MKADLYRALDRQIRLEIGALALAASLVRSAPQDSTTARARTPVDALRAARRPRRRPTRTVLPQERTRGRRGHPDAPVATTRVKSALPPQLADAWAALLREVERDRIAVAAYLTEAEPAADGTLLVLSFHPEHTFHKESLEKNENMQYVAGAVRRHFGDGWRFDVRLDQGVERKALPRELLLEKARLVCQVFDGRIVKEAS